MILQWYRDISYKTDQMPRTSGFLVIHYSCVSYNHEWTQFLLHLFARVVCKMIRVDLHTSSWYTMHIPPLVLLWSCGFTRRTYVWGPNWGPKQLSFRWWDGLSWSCGIVPIRRFTTARQESFLSGHGSLLHQDFYLKKEKEKVPTYWTHKKIHLKSGFGLWRET